MIKMANNQCKECGCLCSKCTNDHDVHLHVEIENLKQRLVERDSHIVTMETNFLNEANKFPNGELMAIREELITWQDKYKRLYESHRRVQRVNQGLEDKLLRLVDVTETDKNTLTKDVATLSHKLAEANYTIKKLTEDNERYKNDVSLAIQFLQCKPANFVSQKFDSLPNEVQAKVSTYMANKRKPEERKIPPEIKSIKVPIPTFPPTAMVYSIPKSPNPAQKEEIEPEYPVDIVSAAIMAKVLEERERERSCVKHCDTCTCSKDLKIIHHTTHHTVSTQTGDYSNSLCLSCNGKLDRPSIVKVVKNVDHNKNKTMPIYIHDYNDTNTNQNVAKVQPNNFLIDTKSETVHSSRIVDANITKADTHVTKLDTNVTQNQAKIKPILLPKVEQSENKIKESVKPDLIDLRNIDLGCSKDNLTSNDIIASNNDITSNDNEETIYFNINEKKADKTNQNRIYYRSGEESKKSDKISAKVFQTSELYKGGRYCSMRLQTGSQNILLDNTPHDVSPILYKRNNSDDNSNKISASSSKITNPESVTSEDAQSGSTVSDKVANIRVAEWIQSNLDIRSTSDCSESFSNKTDDKVETNINKVKYKEMEDNVKRFLFGEYNFLKTVEIGKHKYENVVNDDKGLNESKK